MILGDIPLSIYRYKTMSLPRDPFILLSYVNTKLRDDYENLDEFCAAEGVDQENLLKVLSDVGFSYNEEVGKFL